MTTSSPPSAAALCARHRQAIMAHLRRIEAETRPGRRGAQGRIKGTGLRVAEAMLFRRLSADGQCDPGYDRIAVDAAVSRRSAVSAVARLEAVGVLIRTRRVRRIRAGHRVVIVRRTNAYAWRAPDEALAAWEREQRGIPLPECKNFTGITDPNSTKKNRSIVAVIDDGQRPENRYVARCRWTAPMNTGGIAGLTARLLARRKA